MTSLHTPWDLSLYHSLLVSRVFQSHVLILIFLRNLVMFRKYLHKRIVRLRVFTITSQLASPYLIQHLLDLVSVDKMGQLWISRQCVTLLFKCGVYLTNVLQHCPRFVTSNLGWTHTERSGKKSWKTGSKVIKWDAVDELFLSKLVKRINCFRHLIYLLFFCLASTCLIKQNGICFHNVTIKHV